MVLGITPNTKFVYSLKEALYMSFLFNISGLAEYFRAVSLVI